MASFPQKRGGPGAAAGGVIGFESSYFDELQPRWLRFYRNGEVRGRRPAGASGFVSSYFDEFGPRWLRCDRNGRAAAAAGGGAWVRFAVIVDKRGARLPRFDKNVRCGVGSPCLAQPAGGSGWARDGESMRFSRIRAGARDPPLPLSHLAPREMPQSIERRPLIA